MNEKTEFLIAGDCGLIIKFGDTIDGETNNRIRSFCSVLEKKRIEGIVEVVPTFNSLSVYYDPCIIKGDRLIKKLSSLLKKSGTNSQDGGRTFIIPVLYGGEWGEDLNDVAAHAHLTAEEVIKIHSSTDYLIYMLGFLPGFAYLGGLDERIVTPRLDTPRTKIHAGAVGIGGEQTGIYPLASPGGWRLIGTTPVKIYNESRDEPILYKAGDKIRFEPVTEEEFAEIKKQVEENRYTVKTVKGER